MPTALTTALPFVVDDGGRSAAGWIGQAGDCVTRAIAIATGKPYAEVYAALADREAALGRPRSARNGVARKAYEPYLFDLGWLWVPTMSIGSGCTVHLAAGELPNPDRCIVRLSKHMAAVIDGKVHDTFDPGREGTRCVYGYFEPGAPK